MTINLFDFQREDVDKLRDVEAVLIGNEMGTGKTFEAIALDLIHRAEHAVHVQASKTLVIAPLTVLPSWQYHFGALAGHLRPVVIDPRDRGAFIRSLSNGSGDVYMVHWEALRLMRDPLCSVQWHHVIADECHRAKNRKAQQTRGLKLLKTKFKTGLTGTPVINRPDELWSLLNWLYPSRYRSYWKFYNTYLDYEIVYPQGYHKIKGPKNEEQLQYEIAPFFTRRLKRDVLKDLPPKYYTDLWVELEPMVRKAYNQMKKEMIAWVGQHEDEPLVAPIVIAQLIRLQQFAVAFADVTSDGVKLAEPSSKLDALMQILEDNPDEQVVVFSQFKQLIRLLEARLVKANISHVLLTGDTAQAERGSNVARFQAGDARVFAGTIQAGGVGITLHAASTVVFLDRSWSPALNLQAEDRLHRIGQKGAVQVIDVMARDTVDLGRRQTLTQKWEWIRRLLGDDS